MTSHFNSPWLPHVDQPSYFRYTASCDHTHIRCAIKPLFVSYLHITGREKHFKSDPGPVSSCSQGFQGRKGVQSSTWLQAGDGYSDVLQKQTRISSREEKEKRAQIRLQLRSSQHIPPQQIEGPCHMSSHCRSPRWWRDLLVFANENAFSNITNFYMLKHVHARRQAYPQPRENLPNGRLVPLSSLRMQTGTSSVHYL